MINESDEFQFSILKVKGWRRKIIGSILKVEERYIYFAMIEGGVIRIPKKRIVEGTFLGNAKEETLYWLPENLFIYWYQKKFGRYPYLPSLDKMGVFWAEMGERLARLGISPPSWLASSYIPLSTFGSKREFAPKPRVMQ